MKGGKRGVSFASHLVITRLRCKISLNSDRKRQWKGTEILSTNAAKFVNPEETDVEISYKD